MGLGADVVSKGEMMKAFKAGIKSNDVISSIDDKNTKGMNINDAVKLMRGEPGTKVKVKVLREEEEKPLDFELVRQIIVSKGIKTEIFNDEVGYLRLTSFQSNSTANVRKAIYDLRKKSGNMMVALILDLRNNPGGVLGSAVGISDLFLESLYLAFILLD